MSFLHFFCLYFIFIFEFEFFIREGEKVSNPFSLPETLPQSANCLTLFRWFVDSFFCQDFLFFSTLSFSSFLFSLFMSCL